jgi:DNA segregation ATPase FtsK/SpoIIIE, S-DNA-T family
LFTFAIKNTNMAQTEKIPEKNSNEIRPRHFLFLLGALLLVLAVFSHSAHDFTVIQGGSDDTVHNLIGQIGAYFSCTMLLLFGLATYPFVLILLLCAIRPLIPFGKRHKGHWLYLPVILLGLSLLLAVYPQGYSASAEQLGLGNADAADANLAGGAIGQLLVAPEFKEVPPGILRKYLGMVGAVLLASAMTLGALACLFFCDWLSVISTIVEHRRKKLDGATGELKDVPAGKPAATENMREKLGVINAKAAEAAAILRGNRKKEEPPEPVAEPPQEEVFDKPGDLPFDVPKTKKPTRIPDHIPSKDAIKEAQKANAPSMSEYVLPPISMLAQGPDGGGESLEAVERSCEILQATLDSFGIDGKVTGYVSGPRVTRYDISLAPGIKVEKITSISNNIAMELEAKSVRILAPIPGRNAIGVEAPNSVAGSVFLRGMMESDNWKKSKAELPIILGKDVSGKEIVLDLAKAPHLLIAGSTGSGKSVCMNTLIMSMLFKFRPDELKVIMVDPKVVELAVYTTLPHLITPVINDSQKVPLALRWAVNEMENRYRILAKVRARNLSTFNSRPPDKEPVLDNDGNVIPPKLPLLVIIVDELADLMMTEAKKDVETSIARIAQKGRAAGIHIVIATQRPDRNIITGVIKANLPTRIAFRVTSNIDSRVILDQGGAESLLGYGDMLFIPPGSAVLERIQGAYSSDDEIEKVVEFISPQAPQIFEDVVTEEPEEEPEDIYEFDKDTNEASIYDAPDIAPVVKKYLLPEDTDLLRQALEIALLDRKISTSYLQRRLGVGYNKAATLIDQLEDRGIIGPPPSGGGKREILVFDEIDGI